MVRCNRIALIAALQKCNYSTTHDADIVVIGSGPGGYVASIKAAQMGMKVENWQYSASKNTISSYL